MQILVALILGWFFCSLLIAKISFLVAWMLVTTLGITIDVLRINYKCELETSIGFWLMLGALGPIYLQVLEVF